MTFDYIDQIPSAFWNALFEFHRSICDETIETSVLLTKMLPYFFITNRTNYSRWMPVYILDMLELPAEIKSAFEKGEFSIR